MLKINGGKKTREQASVIVTLPNVFRRVAQFPVSDQEIESAAGEIDRVNARDSRRSERSCGHVALSLPWRSLDRNTAGRQPVDSCECEALGFAVVPTEPAEDPDIV